MLRLPIDILFAAIALLAALPLLGYRRLGSARLPFTTLVLQKLGLFPIRKHYYEPLFDSSSLAKPLSNDRDLPGVDLNVAGQLDFLSKLDFASELLELKLNKRPSHLHTFHIQNGTFEAGDAEFLYQFIRAIRPSKIVEIGSGYSTKLARIALLKNLGESHSASAHICIEPYEMDWLDKLAEITVIRKRVEECTFDWSKELSAGDLLFVDSSHMIRPQGDVLKEYLEIFPQLASGVYIHIHDIFTPKDYPYEWVIKQVRFWNEQYLLEALLSNTERYEVIGTLNYLKHKHFDQLKQACPYLTTECEPGSFYLRVR